MPQAVGSARRALSDTFMALLTALNTSDLCALRAAVGRRLGSEVRALDLFNDLYRTLRREGYLPRWACYVVAGLYPWHRATGGAGDLGDAMLRALSRTATPQQWQAASRRFESLLNTPHCDLHVPLSEAIRFLVRNSIRVDWSRLLFDLAGWDEAGRPTQHVWARSFLGMREGDSPC